MRSCISEKKILYFAHTLLLTFDCSDWVHFFTSGNVIWIGIYFVSLFIRYKPRSWKWNQDFTHVIGGLILCHLLNLGPYTRRWSYDSPYLSNWIGLPNRVPFQGKNHRLWLLSISMNRTYFSSAQSNFYQNSCFQDIGPPHSLRDLYLLF